MGKRYTTKKCSGCGMVTSAFVTTEEFRAAQLAPVDGPKAPGFRFSRMGWQVLPCRGCGVEVVAKPVVGVYSAKHVCSAKCLSSKGHHCECSCGGKNHGAAFA